MPWALGPDGAFEPGRTSQGFPGGRGREVQSLEVADVSGHGAPNDELGGRPALPWHGRERGRGGGG